MVTLSRTDLSDIKKELISLKDQERQIVYLLERFNFDKNLSIPKQLDTLVEKFTKLEDVSEIVKKAGFPPEPKELEQALDRVEDAQSEITMANELIEKASEENQKITEKLESAKDELAQKGGQIAHMKRTLEQTGKGTEKPACWADEKTGKPNYIYNVGLTSDGIIVRLSAAPPWAISRKLPIDSISFNKNLKPQEFESEAKSMFNWSEQNECRFFVRAYDLTGPDQKVIYKRYMKALETAFYKYEVLNDPWR